MYRLQWVLEMSFRTFKQLLGCRNLFSDDRNGMEIQAYCAMIVCMLILIYTGEKPNRAMYQMVWYEARGRRSLKSTRPGANGDIELMPFEFLDRLADLVPPPWKHRHRYLGVFASNHKLRRAVTALAIGNTGKPCDADAGGHAGNAHAAGCCDTRAKPRSYDTSRIAWAKLMARVGEEFPLDPENQHMHTVFRSCDRACPTP